MTCMTNYLKSLWQRLSARDGKVKAEVERIAVLQRAAASRRAEYAETKDQAARKRMEEAEAAHTAALQSWENKQSRQKSR